MCWFQLRRADAPTTAANIQLFMITVKAFKASMNRPKFIYLVLMLIGASVFSSCGSNNDEVLYERDPQNLSGVAVRGFSLQRNAKVLNNLDSVFFSIDLNNARIFNAFPLPYGTDVSALAVNLTTDACKSVTIYAPGEDGEDNEIDYINNDDAKIDFSKGEVKVKLVSSDGEHSRDYFIKVNVNTVVPDSLFWSEMACRAIPGMSNPLRQKTVKARDKAYCLTSDGTSYRMAVSGDLYNWHWDEASTSFPKPVDVRSFTATSTTFYILAEDGELLKSSDATTWAATGEFWRSIVAPWDDMTVLGLKSADGVLKHVTYPATTEVVASAEFPVEGNSASVGFASKWAAQPQIVTMGGRKADGELTGATWAYDGTSWAKISESMPQAEGYGVISYPICETDTISWRLKVSEVMLAFGGKGNTGVLGRDVYVSRDMGITWKKGGISLQLPEYMPSVYEADLVVSPIEMSADAAPTSTGWFEMPVAGVSPYYVRMYPQSRIISATERWECPYLYMFGGIEEGGTLQNMVWRGVVNHFTFRPLE